jgi:hypothetical protein
LDPTSQLLESAGIPLKLQKHAVVEFQPPDDIHDTEAMQRRLREYIAYNINAWVGRRHRSLWIVMAALKDTYALDQKHYAALLGAARAQQTERREGRARDANRTITVRYEHPQPISNSEQGDVAFHHNLDCSLSPTPTLSGAWHTADPSEPHRPEGSAKSASDASQGAERPCHSSIRKTGAALRASSYARASRATLLIQDRSGLSNDTDASTTAGGRKALPYDLGDRFDLDAPGGKMPPPTHSDSPALVAADPAAGSRLHGAEYASAQAHAPRPPPYHYTSVGATGAPG